MPKVVQLGLFLTVPVLLLFTLLALTRPVHAATFTVSSADDSGPGTLRQALALADVSPEADTITFDANLNGATIDLVSAPLTLGSEVTIDASNLPDRIHISGGGARRVFVVSTSAPVTLTNLIIRDGATLTGVGACADLCGGGIYVQFGSNLTVRDSVITENFGNSAGGVYVDFGGKLTLDQTTVISNTSQFDGGGMRLDGDSITVIRDSAIVGNSAGDGGGGLYAQGIVSLEIISGTVADNEADNDTDTSDGGGLYLRWEGLGGRVHIQDSTFARNRGDMGSALRARAAFTARSYLTIVNSTFSGNTAAMTDGGALWASGAGDLTGTLALTLTHVTFVENSSGLVLAEAPVSQTLTVELVNNLFATSAQANCVNVTTDQTNLSDDATCNGFTQGDAKLAPLADNGGPTQTHLPTAGSVALGLGDPAVCQSAPILGRDQRGLPRPADACDVGASEVDDASQSFLPYVTLP